MNRPLLVTDCDEVLLHMVVHFGAWLDEAHDIEFTPDGGDFSRAMRRRSETSHMPFDEMRELLDSFFLNEMHRQTLVPHARESLAEIAQVANIVILTNVGEHCQAHRVKQLGSLGIHYRVVCNQGGKGAPVRRLVDEFSPSVTVFVDDLERHHESVAEHVPESFRLHMIAEPNIARIVAPAPHAHARIDDWRDAKPWIMARFGVEALSGA